MNMTRVFVKSLSSLLKRNIYSRCMVSYAAAINYNKHGCTHHDILLFHNTIVAMLSFLKSKRRMFVLKHKLLLYNNFGEFGQILSAATVCL